MEGANIGIFLTRCVAAKVLSLVGPLVVRILLYPVALLPFLVLGDSSKENFQPRIVLAHPPVSCRFGLLHTNLRQEAVGE